MNTEYLKLFKRIATTKNISQAGKELNLSPAVASAHINKLEDDLGVRLLHRTTRSVKLTEEGKLFLNYADDILSSIDAAKASLGIGEASPHGTLRITVSSSFGRMHLVPILKPFSKQYPNLSLDISFSDTITDIVEGGFDIAIRNSKLEDSSLVARKLASDKRILCASPDFIQRYGEPKTPKDLKNFECIKLKGDEYWTFTPNIKIKPKGKLQLDFGEAVRDATVEGLGIAVISTWNAYKHLQRKELIHLLQNTPLESDTDIWAVFPSSRLLAPKVRVFIDYLSQQFSDPPYWDAHTTS